jgi:catalase
MATPPAQAPLGLKEISTMPTRVLTSIAGVLLLVSVGAPASAQSTDPEAVVNGLFALSGNHAKVRASGAKGTCAEGSFTPTAVAADLSRAPQFTKVVPVTARFSMGGSNPGISDTTKAVTRGFAMRFSDPGGDLVFAFISAPLFGARTPEQLLEGIHVRLPGPDGKVDQEKIRAYLAANPETIRQSAWLNGRPVPASFAGTTYWGVHAYTLTNGSGTSSVAKLSTVPTAGQLDLSEEELKAKPDTFYSEELKGRLARGAVDFNLIATLAEPGDPTNDVTALWSEVPRKTLALGTISIATIVPNEICDQATFDPVINLPEGIAGPANDPMFEIRSPTYAISLSRRSQ